MDRSSESNDQRVIQFELPGNHTGSFVVRARALPPETIQDDEVNSRPSFPCLLCLLVLLALLMLLNSDDMAPPAPKSDHNSTRYDQQDSSMRTSASSSYETQFGFPSASFTLTGNYATLSTSNISSSNYRVLDVGVLRAVLLSRPSVVQSVRLATIRLQLDSQMSNEKHTVALSGLDLRDVSTLTFQGFAPYSVLNLPTPAPTNNASFIEPTCSLLASLRFDRYPSISQSARPVDIQRGGSANWGFDDSDFGEGGEWERRLAAPAPPDIPAQSSFLSQRFLQQNASAEDMLASLLSKQLEDKEFALEDLKNVSVIEDIGVANSTFKDLEGVLVSPDCQVKVILSATEIDLINLANKVVQFAFFFVVKNLLEIRYFLSQVRYTESGGSSVQKVSFISLGLHICLDCFEAIILLTGAVSSSFMTSTFIILAIFKLMFVSVVELKYFVIVLKARYEGGALNENLPRLVKIHALGTAFLLLWTFKLLPILPLVIGCMYLVWVPQIVHDIWKGNRRSLSVSYILGMSICRLVFPLYLWGCPWSVFDGEILKRPPGAPSFALCVFLCVLMSIQVAALMIQQVFGPRVFVPLRFLPDVYNYYRKIPEHDDPESTRAFECVICMTEISYTARQLVITPCDHHFHETCLQQWMDVKAECPTCRGTLPPFP